MNFGEIVKLLTNEKSTAGHRGLLMVVTLWSAWQVGELKDSIASLDRKVAVLEAGFREKLPTQAKGQGKPAAPDLSLLHRGGPPLPAPGVNPFGLPR